MQFYLNYHHKQNMYVCVFYYKQYIYVHELFAFSS